MRRRTHAQKYFVKLQRENASRQSPLADDGSAHADDYDSGSPLQQRADDSMPVSRRGGDSGGESGGAGGDSGGMSNDSTPIVRLKMRRTSRGMHSVPSLTALHVSSLVDAAGHWTQ